MNPLNSACNLLLILNHLWRIDLGQSHVTLNKELTVLHLLCILLISECIALRSLMIVYGIIKSGIYFLFERYVSWIHVQLIQMSLQKNKIPVNYWTEIEHSHPPGSTEVVFWLQMKTNIFLICIFLIANIKFRLQIPCSSFDMFDTTEI